MENFLNIRPAYLEVNIDRVLYNINLIRNRIKKGTKLMASVKGDFYGLGVRGMVPYVDDFVDYYAVAMLSEGVEIRNLGSEKGILILSYTPTYQYKYLLKYNIMPTLYSYEDAKILSDLALEEGRVAKIHIKLDSGMTRIGFEPTEEALLEIEKISKLKGIEIDGFYTHFSSSEETDKTRSHNQAKVFHDFINKLEEKNIDLGKKHISNSGAIIDLPEYNEDLVRSGFSIMGLVEESGTYENLPVLPTCQLKAKIERVVEVGRGTKIGYNCTYTVDEEKMTIATIPVGYADGYKFQLSNKGLVLVNEKLAPIRGKVCMDQLMVDASGIDCKVGDEVILFGYENGAESVLDIAKKAGVGSIDVISSISRRVPRVYIKDNEVVKVIDYIEF